MGLEARCEIRYRPADGPERVGEGAIHLDDTELLARGEARHRIPRATITHVSADGERLVVAHAGGTTTFALGAAASAKWASKIAAVPRSVIEKLEVRAGHAVSAVGVPDDALLDDIATRAGSLTRGRVAADSDVILLGILEPAHLRRIATAAGRLADGGCIWALHPRGVPEVADTKIYAAAKSCGLTYTKVVRVSDALSGEKLVRGKATK